MMRLKEKFIKEVIPVMREKLGYKSSMAVPKIEKVVLNTGFGRLIVGKTGDEPKKIIDAIVGDLTLIAGQKVMPTKAKKAIAAFKTRQGMLIGACCTLRGQRMYDFLERLINVALPRSRDFQGIDPKSIDQSGNLTVALKEHIAFPEISPEKTKAIFSFEITVVTTAKNQKEGLELLKLMGFPIKNKS
ncbi:MAG: 50S ribosomal protein L5 [Candidatus Nealsonbacteria bacterium]